MNPSTKFYRAMHPNQFSDSKIIRSAELDRNFMDFFLSTISSKGLEKSFERFCKGIIEAEVCPNLIPQTGPTGGGDSKVDSESYPVSEVLTESWFYGDGNKAGSERWAFAFSAKQAWKTKAKSDVKKIIDTNNTGRGYTKIFFVSNQGISDKKRAETEDELRAAHGLDVRIFDRNWLLDKVFSCDSNKMIAIECFALSEKLIDEKKVGENDYRRQNRLAEVECSLKNIQNLKPSEIIALTHESVELSRELEVDTQKMFGLLNRYLRLAKEYGTQLDQADAFYESAWTIFWWYPDEKKYYEFYKQFEALTLSAENSYLFEKLITLWMNLNILHMQGFDIDISAHKAAIDKLYETLISDNNKPNRKLQARAAYQHMRIFNGDTIDDIVRDYIDILIKSEGSLELDIYPIKRLVCEIGIFQKSPNYDELFELIISRMSQEKEKAEASRMLAMRGHQISESQPYRAIEYFSRALSGLYNEANRHTLMVVVIELASLFERVGLFWAARNYYYNAVAYSLSQYMKTGEISQIFMLAANKLKWLELQQGRFLYSSEMDMFESIARSLYPSKLEDEYDNFDACLACCIFLTSFEQIQQLGKLPGYLDNRDLPLAAIAVRYELGHYDDQMLSFYNGNKEQVDQYMRELQSQPILKQVRYKPWYGFEDKAILESKILGCHFIVYVENDAFIIEFATSLLAALECFLGTGFSHSIISGVGKFVIEICKESRDGFALKNEYSRDNPTYMRLFVSEYHQNEFIEVQEEVEKRFISIISIIVSVILIENNDFERLQSMVENEATLYRTKMFANSLFSAWPVFGKDTFDFNALTDPYDEIDVLRTEPIILHDVGKEEFKPHEIKYGAPPEEADFSNVSNENIMTSDIINHPLWNSGNWLGTFYAVPADGGIPWLSFLFESTSGLRIFEDWRKRFGRDDVESGIGIRIIKGINKKEPFSYRVAVGVSNINELATSNHSIILTPTRLHTMQPQNDANLRKFESACHDSYYICPALMTEKTDAPEIHPELSILKHKESIKIIHAYEVSSQDMLSVCAILPDDDPIVPTGKDDADIVKILQSKRHIKSNGNTRRP